MATLERWRSQALASGSRERRWTALARLEAVIGTASMDEAARSAWCREQGVFPSELERWRASAVAALGLLHPMIGVVAMTASSLSVIGNSLLLKWTRLEVHGS